MSGLVKEKNKYSIDKGFLLLISAAILAPSLGAIDNNAIRWFILSVISGLYIINLLLSKDYVLTQTKLMLISIFGTFVFLVWSAFNSPNPIEGFISLYKLIIIVAVFFSCLMALKSIEKPLLYISTVFACSLLIEGGVNIMDYFNQGNFTGIANNKNISSSSIIIKLPFLIYLISKSSNISQKNFYRMVEFLSIISVVLLQSRLGLASMILIYVMMFFYFKVSKKQFIVPLLMVLLSLSAINYWNLNQGVEKNNYNVFNLSTDESTNQRINFYSLALDLFSNKPITGNGLGSWKYESLKYKDPTSKSILVPYYTHNDFLQILVELGLIGLIIYLLFFISLLSRLIMGLKDKDTTKILLIAIIIFLFNSMLNFPIHRSQEYIPFIIISALLFSLTQNKNAYEMRKSYIFLLLLLLIPSGSLAYYEHKSLVVQKKLLYDYELNSFTLRMQELDKINYQIPNLSANTVPVSTYLSRYFININDYEKALTLLEDSYKANQNDLMTNELLLKVFLFKQNNYLAYKKAKELFFNYYNNENYAELYFSLAINFNLINEVLSSDILIKSENVKVHRIFFQKIIKLNTLENDVVKESLKYSVNKFPQDKYLEELFFLLD